MAKKHPFDLKLAKVANAGSNDLAMDAVEDGRLYCVQHVAIENETSAFTDLRILKAGVGAELLLEEQDSPQAATLYWSTAAVYLTEGQYLVARFSGCTASDRLKASSPAFLVVRPVTG